VHSFIECLSCRCSQKKPEAIDRRSKDEKAIIDEIDADLETHPEEGARFHVKRSEYSLNQGYLLGNIFLYT